MTRSIIDFNWSRTSERPAQLKHTRSGLRHIEKAHRQIASTLPHNLVIQRAEDFLNGIAHELRFLEGFPANALGPIQQIRLEKLCQQAMASLRSIEDELDGSSFRRLKDAFENLLPLISKDFDSLTVA